MLFNSLPFLIFIAVFFLLWPLMRREKDTRWMYALGVGALVAAFLLDRQSALFGGFFAGTVGDAASDWLGWMCTSPWAWGVSILCAGLGVSALLASKGPNSRWIFLTTASFFFYGWWDARYLLLLIANGLVNFATGLAMKRHPRRKRALLVVSICVNVGSLAFFKYADFIIGNVNRGLGFFGAEEAPLLRLGMIVGISFYTFQAMSYSIDCYRGRLAPTSNVFHFFAYLSMFPQLVAGPIVRAADLLPQLAERRRPTEQQRWEGLKLIVYGFFKKVVVADNIARFVSAAIETGPDAPLIECGAFWWLTMLLFAYQIYCDFSGYSDIARGLGKWMGYEFPVNFDHPYIADSFRNFWQRWHISLSTWFRDYVYIPLGGSGKGPAPAMVFMTITMVVSGLWHGAAWTFVLWGAMHAAYLAIERLTRWPTHVKRVPFIGRHTAVLLVFLLTLVSWVPFLSKSIGQAGQVLALMFDASRFINIGAIPDDALVTNEVMNIVLFIIARQLWFHFRLDSRRRWTRWLTIAASGRPFRARPDFASLRARAARTSRVLAVAESVGGPLAIACLVVLAVYMRGPGTAFIYFQF